MIEQVKAKGGGKIFVTTENLKAAIQLAEAAPEEDESGDDDAEPPAAGKGKGKAAQQPAAKKQKTVALPPPPATGKGGKGSATEKAKKKAAAERGGNASKKLKKARPRLCRRAAPQCVEASSLALLPDAECGSHSARNLASQVAPKELKVAFMTRVNKMEEAAKKFFDERVTKRFDDIEAKQGEDGISERSQEMLEEVLEDGACGGGRAPCRQPAQTRRRAASRGCEAEQVGGGGGGKEPLFFLKFGKSVQAAAL